MLPAELTNRIVAFQKETETSSEGGLSNYLRLYSQLHDSEGG